MAGCYALLRRITRLVKSVNSEIKSKDQTSYLDRYSPLGFTTSCRTDVSSTLAQNCHCEFCCGVPLARKNISITPDWNGSVKDLKSIEKLPSP